MNFPAVHRHVQRLPEVKRRRVGEPGAASVFEARSQGDRETKPTRT
jgi:hypothetical protein